MPYRQHHVRRIARSRCHMTDGEFLVMREGRKCQGRPGFVAVVSRADAAKTDPMALYQYARRLPHLSRELTTVAGSSDFRRSDSFRVAQVIGRRRHHHGSVRELECRHAAETRGRPNLQAEGLSRSERAAERLVPRLRRGDPDQLVLVVPRVQI